MLDYRKAQLDLAGKRLGLVIAAIGLATPIVAGLAAIVVALVL